MIVQSTYSNGILSKFIIMYHGNSINWEIQNYKLDDFPFYLNQEDRKTKKPWLLMFWCGSGYGVDAFVVFANGEREAKSEAFQRLRSRCPQIIWTYDEALKQCQDIALDNWESSDDPDDPFGVYSTFEETFIEDEENELCALEENFMCEEITDKVIINKINNFLNKIENGNTSK